MKQFLLYVFVSTSLYTMDNVFIEPYNKEKHENEVTRLFNKTYKKPFLRFEKARVLIIDENVVGFVSYTDNEDPFLEEIICSINHFKVKDNDPEYGTLITSYMFDTCKSTSLVTEVSYKDITAQQWYESLQFNKKPIFLGWKIQYKKYKPQQLYKSLKIN